ncbi:MAG: NAD(P)-binding protein [Deltaproteobacteria bacterium]|nr:NAD(P)-binding protein [Deltaproteobacteria bacterium]
MNRRQFILSSAKIISAIALPSFAACRSKPPRQVPFRGSILGPSPELGHRLMGGEFPPPSSESKMPVVIIGGGISGLSAGWKLWKAGFSDFEILEVEPEVGGVSRPGENRITAFPWGAHYLPLPTPESRAVRELLEDLGVIEGYNTGGQPIYQEKYLCFSPQERLFIHGRWQEGILPQLGMSRKDLDQFRTFQETIDRYKQRRGRNGQKAFTIPMERSARDRDLLDLDRISMLEFLKSHNLDSAPLHWYVNYACRDDYGCSYREVSAWAGLHYFCSRSSDGEKEEATVLTWPEGNGWIVHKLNHLLRSKIVTKALVYRLENRGKEVRVDVYHPAENISRRVRAAQVIFACPRRFARFMFPDSGETNLSCLHDFRYSPWLVANLSLKSFPEAPSGAPIAWDNVIYDSPSLGYVVATHQSLKTHIPEMVVTYYHALAWGPVSQERTYLLQTPWRIWADFILKDLSKPHPEISNLVTRLDIFRWGHAMIQPRVGFIWGDSRRQAARPRGNIYFAHSDLSGFSIFEEAQYRGVLAAEKVLARHGIPFVSSL